MNAIRIRRVVDEATARAIPELRPLVGRPVELIVLEAGSPRQERRSLTVEELLARRRSRPEGVAPVTLDDIDQAIAEEATRSAGF